MYDRSTLDTDREGPGNPPVKPHRIAGTPFGKYTLLCKLATGGMGELFVARRTGAGGFEKLVVIKRLLPHLAEDAHFVAMLLDEARIAARLSHPNVCQVYDLGEVDGHYYIAMEHLEGVPSSLVLRRASRAGQRLELGLATAILRQAADGLHHAHDLCDHDGNSVGLVHRDVSPSNLFITSAGVVKVLDFGVAKSQDALARTHTGALKGKYAYMSPEQVLGDPVDRRSDVWSLGIVLYELLTAQRLFWRDSEYKMFQAIVDEAIPSLLDRRPGLPLRVARVAEKALSRDPRQRFASAQDMGEALEEAMAGSDGLWRPVKVADYLGGHFAPLMQERREEVQAGLAGASRPSAPGSDSEESVVTAGAILSDGDVEIEEVEEQLENAIAPEPDARGGRRGWVGGLAVAVTLAAGVLAYRQWWPPPAREPTPVVVVGGEVETMDVPVGRAPLQQAPRPVPAPAADDGPRPVSSTVSDSPQPVSAPASPEPELPADPYSAALAREQAAIRLCFDLTGTAIAGAPELSVGFDIDRRGVVQGASVLPQALEATPFGECVLAAAGRVRFPEAKRPVRVTIPIQVRRQRR